MRLRSAALGLALALAVAGAPGAGRAQDPRLIEAAAVDSQAVQLFRAARYAEAESLMLRVLALREQALGPLHPEVANAVFNLAQLFRVQGRYADAAPGYVRAAQLFERAFGPEDPTVARALNGLGETRLAEGRYAAAEALFERALAIRERALPPGHADVATSLGNLAELRRQQGRPAEAEPMVRRALLIYEAVHGPEHAFVATTLSNLAALLEARGRFAEAEPLHRRALAIREAALPATHPDLANGLNNLAFNLARQGRSDEAVPLYERALAIREAAQGRFHPAVAATLSNLAMVARERGDLDAAERLVRRALEIDEHAFGPEHPDVAVGLNNLAVILTERRRFAEAGAMHRRALAARERALGPDHPALATSLVNIARVELVLGRPDEALRASRRAVAIARAQDALAAGTPSAGRAPTRAIYLSHVDILEAAADAAGSTVAAAEEAFLAAQRARGSRAARAVAGMAARFAAGVDSRGALVREREDAAERWRTLDGELLRAAARPRTARDDGAERAAREEAEALRKRVAALDARLIHEFPGYAALVDPAPLSLAEAGALLGPDEALLVYALGESALRLWLVRPGAFHAFSAGRGEAELADAVRRLRAALDPALNPGLAPFPAGEAHALHATLIGPAAPLLAGVRHLLVVPDGALESLPFAVLVTRAGPEPVAPEHHRMVAWLARDHAISVLPAVASLRALRGVVRSAARAPAAFVGIGDPVLRGHPGAVRAARGAAPFRGRLADVAQLREFDALPETAAELRAVAAFAGGGDLFLAERASERLLRAAPLDRYRIVHFATHGLMSGELEGLAEPALVLTPPAVASAEDDGLLTASEIATLRLDADWVVLSACNTAAPDGTPDADGLSGLARAFFHAGTRALLVSHWMVASQPTVALTTGAFAALAAEPAIGRAEALRRAMRAMLDPARPAEYAHPLVWAPFVLVGEGGAGR